MGGYDHQTKVGNQGDLVKHFSLLQVADNQRHRQGRQFVYAETHAGRARYTIDDAKQSQGWTAGVGYLLNHKNSIVSSCNEADELLVNAINDFVNTIEKDRVGGRFNYSGSSSLVLDRLQEKGIDHQGILFDTNQAVCSELNAHTERTTEVRCACGYDGVKGIKGIDLLFIDPPDLKPPPDGQTRDFKYLVYHCIHNDIPFVSWNPLYGKSEMQEPSFECSLIRELGRVQHIGIVEVRWNDWSERMCGCQMLFNVEDPGTYVDLVQRLADVMGWDVTYF